MLETLSGETLLYPIIGDPIRFVKSPQTLTAALQARGHNGVCVPMQVAKEDLARVMSGLTATPNVRAVLVTMPHKTAIVGLCATLSVTAKLVGAVNLARRNPDGSWHGEMLDGVVFAAAQEKHGAKLKGARALLIGAGGAGGAIAVALLDAGVARLIVHDIDHGRRDRLVARLADVGQGRARPGPPDPTSCDMLFNATPLGMSPDDPLPVDTGLLTARLFVGDVVAGHGVTPLIQAATAAGCKTADGVAMVEAGMDVVPSLLIGDAPPLL